MPTHVRTGVRAGMRSGVRVREIVWVCVGLRVGAFVWVRGRLSALFVFLFLSAQVCVQTGICFRRVDLKM